MPYNQVLDIIGLDTGSLQVSQTTLSFFMADGISDKQQYITLYMPTCIELVPSYAFIAHFFEGSLA
jgi:hypothetical protein